MIRFQADADFNQLILRAFKRREPSADFRTATRATLAGLSDPEVLEMAADEERILVTHDAKTMPGHFADFISRRSSPGVIIVPQHLPIGEVAEHLLLIWSATEPEEWVDRIYWLSF